MMGLPVDKLEADGAPGSRSGVDSSICPPPDAEEDGDQQKLMEQMRAARGKSLVRFCCFF